MLHRTNEGDTVAFKPTSTLPSHPDGNRLLAALPSDCLDRLHSGLIPVAMPTGMVLHEPGQTVTQVYFPTDSIVSHVSLLATGEHTEIALTGREGMVGVAMFMGGGSTCSRAVVQRGGEGIRLDARMLRGEFDRGEALMHLLLKYTQALITHVSQTAVCNRHHSLDQRLCRWLLLNLDRQIGNELALTHELIAGVLGVRRESVTEAALKLRAAGAIRYSHGHVDVLDRPKLEHRACECYEVVRREHHRLLPPPSDVAHLKPSEPRGPPPANHP